MSLFARKERKEFIDIERNVHLSSVLYFDNNHLREFSTKFDNI